MKRWAVTIVFAGLSTAGCGGSSDRGTPVQRSRSAPANPDSVAGKTGKAAYSVAKESGKAAKKAGSALKRATRDAAAGWKEASREAKR